MNKIILMFNNKKKTMMKKYTQLNKFRKQNIRLHLVNYTMHSIMKVSEKSKALLVLISGSMISVPTGNSRRTSDEGMMMTTSSSIHH